MTKYFKACIVILGFFIWGLFLISRYIEETGGVKNDESISSGINQDENEIVLSNKISDSQNKNEEGIQSEVVDSFDKNNIPLKNMVKRIIVKPFGIFITPEASPIQPERFRGYHTGLDLEIFEDEKDAVVSVRALCDGRVLQKRFVAGYGGVVLQECLIDGEVVTILYGHLKVESFTKKVTLVKGDILGDLGRGETKETDFERKHLHLGVYRSVGVNLKGYVLTREELKGWLNPCSVINCADLG